MIKNERTGEQRTVISGSDGTFVAASLKPSVYTLKSTVSNFAPLEYSGLELAARSSTWISNCGRPVSPRR